MVRPHSEVKNSKLAQCLECTSCSNHPDLRIVCYRFHFLSRLYLLRSSTRFVSSFLVKRNRKEFQFQSIFRSHFHPCQIPIPNIRSSSITCQPPQVSAQEESCLERSCELAAFFPANIACCGSGLNSIERRQKHGVFRVQSCPMAETRIAQADPTVRPNACTGPCGHIHTLSFVAKVRNKTQKAAQANSKARPNDGKLVVGNGLGSHVHCHSGAALGSVLPRKLCIEEKVTMSSRLVIRVLSSSYPQSLQKVFKFLLGGL